MKPLLEKGKEKDEFSMTIGGKEYTDGKEAGTALIAACAGLKEVKTSGQVGEFYGFQMSAGFDSFNQKYMVTLKRQCSYKIEVGKDAWGICRGSAMRCPVLKREWQRHNRNWKHYSSS